ncbi:hypothetical protein, partial [Sphaerotilus natans]|uniref:hypothetical protein n=1 Tax=Sphaerotilus natans TaxID=34103 RepID=UPI0019D38038
MSDRSLETIPSSWLSRTAHGLAAALRSRPGLLLLGLAVLGAAIWPWQRPAQTLAPLPGAVLLMLLPLLQRPLLPLLAALLQGAALLMAGRPACLAAADAGPGRLRHPRCPPAGRPGAGAGR